MIMAGSFPSLSTNGNIGGQRPRSDVTRAAREGVGHLSFQARGMGRDEGFLLGAHMPLLMPP